MDELKIGYTEESYKRTKELFSEFESALKKNMFPEIRHAIEKAYNVGFMVGMEASRRTVAREATEKEKDLTTVPCRRVKADRDKEA